MVTYDIQIQMTDDLIKEIGNAIAAYGLILGAAWAGTQVPRQFEAFKSLPDEDLHRRMTLLKPGRFKSKLVLYSIVNKRVSRF